MASVNILHNCGCGFTTLKLEEAVNHCDAKGHTMTVQGNIQPENKPLPGARRVKAEPHAPTADEFTALRDKLRRTA